MNNKSKVGLFRRIYYKCDYWKRLLDFSKNNNAFYNQHNKKFIERVYVINLDRKADRWKTVKKELKRIKTNNNSLYEISRRFSAIDARYLEIPINSKLIFPYYKLSDQFKVEPNEKYTIKNNCDDKDIKMTIQEIAVTLSHIEVWKKIQEENIRFSLVLEDDIYFSYGFSKTIDDIWNKLEELDDFDILFLSYEYAQGIKKNKFNHFSVVHKPDGGIWQASGYVLSNKGVNKLLDLLPVYGPVDLWFNLQFDKLKVYYSEDSIIKQRSDISSSNAYSIMPILSQLGLYNDTTPSLMKEKQKLPLVLAYGEKGSGISSLAVALSMIGYTCCNNLVEFKDEVNNDNFNAFINVGLFDEDTIIKIYAQYNNLHLIIASDCYNISPILKMRVPVLFLEKSIKDKWESLTTFLNFEYPCFQYPFIEDVDRLNYEVITIHNKNTINRKFDKLPWIIKTDGWHGIQIFDTNLSITNKLEFSPNGNVIEDNYYFYKRNDTFSGNLALFQEENVISTDNTKLVFKEKDVNVRNYTSGALASKHQFRYGVFSAEIKPSNVSGIITGMFLHRNGPHQEIDIEFLGDNTRGFLINVFYNPGIEGTKLEYGYRGTPTWIPLDFDVSKEFHKYEIEWNKYSIVWKVDDICVYERHMWAPTPIPELPMEFNVNIWASNSKELAGRLNINCLPTISEIRALGIKYVDSK